jgi:LysM repeat protein
MLSSWFGNPSLSPAEAEQVEMLLGQLAGTVIYSTEHRLEPPYTVRPGETLEQIAQQHGVPWQLLSKINGVPGASPLPAGQQLKVVRGPFEGELDLRRNLLALKVDGRYAGKFAVSPPSDANLPTGDWIVQEKPSAPAARQSVYGGQPAGQLALEHSLILRSATANATNAGQTILIRGGSAATPSLPTGAAANATPPILVKVAPRDAEELSDILSIGSRIVIRR